MPAPLRRTVPVSPSPPCEAIARVVNRRPSSGQPSPTSTLSQPDFAPNSHPSLSSLASVQNPFVLNQNAKLRWPSNCKSITETPCRLCSGPRTTDKRTLTERRFFSLQFEDLPARLVPRLRIASGKRRNIKNSATQ